MKAIRKILMGFMVAAGFGVALLPTPALAVNVFDQCAANADSAVCKSKNDDASNMIKDVVNLLLYAVGVIAVIMIVVGGIRYTTSNGDASGITSAKNTILYAIVGLVVAMLSFAIVNFVLGRF